MTDQPASKLETASALLEQLQTSRILGFCYVDSDGRQQVMVPTDELFREMLLAYQSRQVQALLPKKETLLSRQKLNRAYE